MSNHNAPQIPEDHLLDPEPEDVEISLDELVRLLKIQGLDDAYVEQTGGGCATVYVRGGRVQAGPGWFAGPNWSDGRGSLAEFNLGWDSDARGASEQATQELVTASDVPSVLAHIVERIQWYATHLDECPYFMYDDDPSAYAPYESIVGDLTHTNDDGSTTTIPAAAAYRDALKKWSEL